MTWYVEFWRWLIHAAAGGLVFLAIGCLAIKLCREPVRRLRLAELTMLGCLLVPWLNLVPGLQQFTLGWLKPPEVRVAGTPPVSDLTSPVLPGVPTSAAPGSRVGALEQSLREPVSTVPFAPAQPSVASIPPGAADKLSHPLPLVVAYLGVAAGFVVWWLAGLVQLLRLCRFSYPAPEHVVAVFQRIAGPGGRRVRLLASDRIELPLMFGWPRSVIIVPASLCRSGDVTELSYALAHEWSHIERRDILAWHLASLVQVLFFYQPLLWWLRRQLRLGQDYLADARAAEQAAVAENYADYLVALARRRLGSPVPVALGIGDRRSNLYRRIIMLVSTRKPLQRRCRRLWSAAAALATVVVLAAVGIVRLDARTSLDEQKGSPPKEIPKATENKPIPYTGRVFDKISKNGIANATVTVRRTTYGDPKGEKTLQETKHKTDADGRYSFVIPPEQAAERYLYIELDVEAPGYAPRSHFGYAFGMIQKNEKLGGRPFFENVDMRAAKEITGRIETPEGKPAAGVKVMAYSNAEKQDGFEYGSFANARTDAAGRFRLWLITPGPAVFWLLPESYAPSTHVLKEHNKRGDLGRFTLENGLTIKGRVLDTQSKPVAGVFVHADRRGGIQDFNLPVADHIRRTAVTDDQGEFALAPLPPGDYEVMPQESGWDPSKDDGGRQRRPLSGVFLRKHVSLKSGFEPEPLDLRAVPHVVIEAQYFDAKGKTTRGHAGHMFGRLDKNNTWFAEGKMDANGKMTILAPHGLTDARLSLMTNEHGVLRFRLKKGDQLRAEREINLGTLNDDVRSIEIIRYVAPILLVDAKDKDGKQVKDFKPKLTYASGVNPKGRGEFVNGVQGDVYLEKQEDGRWRSNQLLPDEEITVTVSAKGYKSHSQKVKLAEGTTRELAPVLDKD
jgi:hypothetical protein